MVRVVAGVPDISILQHLQHAVYRSTPRTWRTYVEMEHCDGATVRPYIPSYLHTLSPCPRTTLDSLLSSHF